MQNDFIWKGLELIDLFVCMCVFFSLWFSFVVLYAILKGDFHVSEQPLSIQDLSSLGTPRDHFVPDSPSIEPIRLNVPRLSSALHQSGGADVGASSSAFPASRQNEIDASILDPSLSEDLRSEMYGKLNVFRRLTDPRIYRRMSPLDHHIFDLFFVVVVVVL